MIVVHVLLTCNISLQEMALLAFVFLIILIKKYRLILYFWNFTQKHYI